MKQKNKMLSTHGIKTLFETRLTQLTSLASESQDETAFKNKLNDYLLSGPIYNPAAARQIKRLIDNDGKTIYEASTEQEIKIETISLLWKFLTNRIINEEISVDLWIDLYHQFDRLYHEEEELPDEKQVQQWMKRWPSGLNEDVRAIRRQNKERIISLLIQKIENRHAPSSRYLFPEGSTEEDKRRLVCQWWNEARFHLAMAVKSPTELNRMLGNSLSEETLQLYHKARKKGMPVFITPYYLSLLNPTGKGYDDEAIRSYILYSSQLVETYGNIHAWEKEDAVEDGKPNAAGWLLPDGHNIHRRYPDVAILIPDSMGRACGGLCASCQRMYDFQSERLNFNFEELKPKESWDKRLKKLMEYFENDTQLRDILITGGDALMILNKTYGFSTGALAAPQANAMAAVIDPLMNGVGAPWLLYGIGAVLALVLTYFKVPALAFALGMFIPLELNLPLLVGGAVNWYVTTRSKDEAVNAERGEKGTLLASGFIAGGALMGVVSAAMRFGGINLVNEEWLSNPLSEVLSIVAYILLIIWLVKASMHIKKK